MHPYFTPSAQAAIVGAIEISLEEKRVYVGTEHLLLAMLREPDHVAAVALANLGLAAEALRQEIDKLTRTENTGPGAAA
jgi:ATP-dependent Clp protease ATP-binding subunit ClpA